MAQLPSRISIRPLAKFQNRTKTHSVALKTQGMQIDVKYAYQSLRNKVDYDNISDVRIYASDNAQSDPLSKKVTIMTKNRQIYDIPEMDTFKATQLKEKIETQQEMMKITNKKEKRESAVSGRVGGFVKYRR